jgi:hypothetical protein
MNKKTKKGELFDKSYFDFTNVLGWTITKDFICYVSKEDNEKYGLNANEINGTFIAEFSKDEWENWKRTKTIDKMLNDNLER